MNWVDLIVIGLVLVSVLHGFRAGAVVQILLLVGLGVGLFAGILLAPLLASLFDGTARTLVAILVTALCTFSIGFVAEQIGRRLHRALGRRHLGTPDALVGAAVGAITTVLLAWVFGTILSNSRYPTLNRSLQESSVLRVADRLLPPLPEVLARVESFLSSRGYPIVFIDLPPGLVSPAALPDDASIRDAFIAAHASTVKVTGSACGLVESGSGFVVGKGLVLTNAHVVAGEQHTQVISRGATDQAEVVVYDPNLDVAVLRVPGLTETPLPVLEQLVARGTTGAILGYPGGGSLRAEPAAVTARLQATGLNIYGTTVVTRSVYEIHGDVEPGNSGGPLVASGESSGSAGLKPGTVMGVIFASSPTAPSVAYALTSNAVAPEITQAQMATGPVSTGACVP